MLRWICLMLVLVMGCSCERKSTEPTCQRQEGGFGPDGTSKVALKPWVTGLEVPWGLGFVSKTEVLVTERPGRVRLIKDGKLMDKVVLTVQDTSGGEGGLLGLALHPSFSKNRFFYLYYTLNKDGKTINRVHRYKLSPDSTNATNDKIILDDIPAARFHNGGRLRFGPDGMLYIGTGDARQPSLSQDKDSLAGKILRVTPEGDIPADNPWPGKATYIIGIRNTQGFDWLDSETMVVTDHGPSGEMVGRRDHDEVHIAKAGENLGWPNIYACESSEGLLSPLLTWAKAVPPGGAALYTGTRFPDWQGNLLIGALGAKHLHRVVFDAQRKLSKHEVYFLGDAPSGHGRLREVMMGPDGELYVTTSNCDGRGNCPKDKDHILRLTSK